MNLLQTSLTIKWILLFQHIALKVIALGFQPSLMILLGITGTNTGFYGPQGRSLRIPTRLDIKRLKEFSYDGLRITNFEMETAAIYGLCNLLGHRAISFNVILANRALKSFSVHPKKSIDALIEQSLNWIIETLS